MKAYKDNTALITGASSGIGLALAHALARRGAHVILTARSTETLNDVAVEIRKTGVRAHVFPEDLSRPAAAGRLHDAITRAGLTLTVDLLVNNAGYGRWGSFSEFDRVDYGDMIQLNITALTELCHLFIPDMITGAVEALSTWDPSHPSCRYRMRRSIPPRKPMSCSCLMP